MSIKVVVFDDKPLIRKAIMKYIDWETLNCVVAGHADNGLDGERLIREQRPDIIISDIKMPGKDGLELARLARKTLPDASVILITGYQEFEFAREAVKAGAFDFILKPIHYPDLEKTVRQAVQQCCDRRRTQQEQVMLQERLRLSQPLLRSKFVSDLIVGGVSYANGDSMTELAAHLGMEHYIPYSLLLIRPEKELHASPAIEGPSIAYPEKLLRALEDVLATVGDGRSLQAQAVSAIVNGDAVAVISAAGSAGSRQAADFLAECCRRLQSKIGAEAGCRHVVVASSCYNRLDRLQQAYYEAVTQMESRFFALDYSVGRTTVAEGLPFYGLIQFIYNMEQLEQFDIYAALQELLDQISSSSGGSKQVARGFLIEICFALRRYYVSHFGSEFGLHKTADQMIEDVYRLTDLNEALSYMMSQVEEVNGRLAEQAVAYSPIVRQVQAFIAASYAQDLSLTSVARQFDMNPSYLSRILSQETGIPFVELVARTRIAAAKRLLKDPSNRVNEVSEMVGFKDYNYFYRIFKKYEGTSPTEYKKE